MAIVAQHADPPDGARGAAARPGERHRTARARIPAAIVAARSLRSAP